MSVAVGACGQADLKVTENDTALAMGTGEVEVLATPRVVQLCEEASVKALGSDLPQNQTSVGLRVELTHITPVSVGSEVKATATLERCEGRRVFFSVSVADARGLVAAGRITRVLVERSAFLDKAR